MNYLDFFNEVLSDSAQQYEHGLRIVPPYFLDITAPCEEQDYMLYDDDGIGYFSRGDIQAFVGGAKSGKSTAAIIYISAMLSGDMYGFHTVDRQPRKLLWVDTEQNEVNVRRNVRYVYRTLKWPTKSNNPLLSVLVLRPCGYRERIEIIEKAIKSCGPDYVFIDGIADLVDDINDLEGSSAIVAKLMTLTAEYNCAICSVIHCNKDNDDTKLRGHLGTALTNKCSEAYRVRRDIVQRRTTVSPMYMRNDAGRDLAFEVSGKGDSKEIKILSRDEVENAELRMLTASLNKAFADVDGPLNKTQFRVKMGFSESDTKGGDAVFKKCLYYKLIDANRIPGKGNAIFITYKVKEDFAGIDLDEIEADAKTDTETEAKAETKAKRKTRRKAKAEAKAEAEATPEESCISCKQYCTL